MESHAYLPYTCILRVPPVPLSYVGQAGLPQGIQWVPPIQLHPMCPSCPIVLQRTSGTVSRNSMGTSYMFVLSHCPMYDKRDCPTESHGYLQCTCILRVCPVPLSYVGQVGLSHGIP